MSASTLAWTDSGSRGTLASGSLMTVRSLGARCALGALEHRVAEDVDRPVALGRLLAERLGDLLEPRGHGREPRLALGRPGGGERVHQPLRRAAPWELEVGGRHDPEEGRLEVAPRPRVAAEG